MKKISNFKFLMSARKGFTLIELLIVIAVLGILAAVVLVAIDPVQQLARGRDGGRKSAIGQMGRAIQSYYTVHSANPTVALWVAATNILVGSGEIKTFPSNPSYTAGGAICTPAANKFPSAAGVNGYCYNIQAATPFEAIVYGRMESRSENAKCGTLPAWFVFSTADGRAGTVCLASGTDPGPGSQTFVE